MEPTEFSQLVALAALAVPADPEERDAFAKASELLDEFGGQVERDPASGGASAHARAGAPLRPDEPRGCLPEGAVLAAAPESGERLVLVPRIL